MGTLDKNFKNEIRSRFPIENRSTKNDFDGSYRSNMSHPSRYYCRVCPATNDWYLDRCPVCGSPGMWPAKSFKNAPSPKLPPPLPTTFRGAAPLAGIRMSTGIIGFDRVLGHYRGDPEKRTGLARPSVVLLAGEAGSGKSTLAMQMAAYCSDRRVMYNSTEQPLGEIRANADGIGLGDSFLDVEARAIDDLPVLIEELHKVEPHILILDSINDLKNSASKQKDVLVAQVEIAQAFMRESADFLRTILLIAHLNADGGISGRADLRHAVGVTLMFAKMGPKRRILRAMKNRFGATSEVAMFDMEEGGLVDVETVEEARSAAANQQSAPDVPSAPPPKVKRGMY